MSSASKLPQQALTPAAAHMRVRLCQARGGTDVMDSDSNMFRVDGGHFRAQVSGLLKHTCAVICPGEDFILQHRQEQHNAGWHSELVRFNKAEIRFCHFSLIFVVIFFAHVRHLCGFRVNEKLSQRNSSTENLNSVENLPCVLFQNHMLLLFSVETEK